MLNKFLLFLLFLATSLLCRAQSLDVSEGELQADTVAASAQESGQAQQEAQSFVAVSRDYTSPQKYVIAEISISGVKFHNTDQVIDNSGLNVGDTISIPGDVIPQAMKRLWANGRFSDVNVSAKKVEGDKIYLDIYLQERPRILSYDIKGVKKGDREDLQGMLNIRRGAEYSEFFRQNSIGIIERFYREKGFKNVEVTATVKTDTSVSNSVRVVFEIKRNSRIRVAELDFEGNVEVSSRRLRSSMKEVHRRRWYKFWQSTKFIQTKLDEDKTNIVNHYNEKGYRDAKVLNDSVWVVNRKRVGVKIQVYEGKKYYFRDITWVGNTKYPSEMLDNMLKLRKGDVYDKVTMEKRLLTNENSVATLYQDDGYLFSRIDPVEVRIDGDSVDMEMRVEEGRQATINNIFIKGNNKTNEHVIRRELYTRPGDLWSKTNVVRSIRELAQMGHFDPEKLNVDPRPNPADETVDITYIVEEKPNDQIELSGGWGANMFVGTIGLRLTNFSMGRVFQKDAWKPLPSGDNQQLAIRGQTNGSFYKAISVSFTEPWLGGRKPQSLSVSVYYTNQNNASYFYQTSSQSMQVVGAAVGMGQRLKWPDSYFTLYTGVDYQRYILNDWTGFVVENGSSNNFSVKTILGRNSTDQPIYPRRGSEFTLGLQITPPYSLFSNKDYSSMSDDDKFKWIEYHKWTFRTAWFGQIVGDFVWALKSQFGYLGMFNSRLGVSPFERFTLGGDGMSGYNLYGVETVGLRGYENGSLTPFDEKGRQSGATVYDKFTVELRYPFILSPQSTIYGLVFFEAGNAWMGLDKFNPFSVKRSAGAGVRLMLPMIGLLGIDWGYGFDAPIGSASKSGSQIHFIIGMPF